MKVLKNSFIQIQVNPVGAELSSIKGQKSHTELMWSGDSNIWNGISPILFPIVGGLKNDSFTHDSKSYQLPRHGFARRNDQFTLVEESNSKLTFSLTSNEDTRKKYPFEFDFFITYELKDNEITITYKTVNKGNSNMFFSIGAHPAFKCPVFEGETYQDYVLEFNHEESSKRQLLNQDGLYNLETEHVFTTPNSIELTKDLFDKDALVFTDLKSEVITLKSKINGDILSVKFSGWPYMGIWAKPNAPFVCIEPWLGLADHINTNQELSEKLGIITLKEEDSHTASYSIIINNKF